MKKIYKVISRMLQKRVGKTALFLTCLGSSVALNYHAQITYSFTSTGLTGVTGPTQAQLNTAYASTNLNGSVTATGGIQTFVIPYTGPYRISATGAQGGYNGGFGAVITGNYNFTAGTVLKIIVGQQGTQAANTNAPPRTGGGGGGGSFVTDASNIPYVVAGGGGGNGDGYTGTAVTNTLAEMQGNLTTSGFPFPGGTGGGTGGNGGTCGSLAAGGGAGITGNGPLCSSGSAALSFVNGGTGGNGSGTPVSGFGGFGGGGGGYNSAAGNRGGGGGGYSGGAGGNAPLGTEPNAPGGGGGSYSSGTGSTAAVSTNTGSGMVILTFLCDVSIRATGGTNSITPAICSGQTVTLTTNAVSNYTWSNGTTTSNTIAVSPTTTTTYSVYGTSALGCSSGSLITVTVNSLLPTLSYAVSASTVCLGAVATISATGTGITYTINNGAVTNSVSFTPTITSNYTIVTGNGCGTTTSITAITVAPLPVPIAPSSTLICASSPATLTASGATTYTWMPGTNTNTSYIVSPSATTVYTVTGQTGNCIGINTITVNTKANPTISITPSGTAICQGNSVNLVASGTSTSYAWSTGQSGTSISVAPTTLTLVTVTGTNSNNCFASVGQLIYVNPNPTITASASNPVVCVNGPSTLTASGADTYTWSTGPVVGTSVVVNPAVNSVYNVAGSYSTGCSSATAVSVSVLTPTISVTSNTAVCSGSHVAIGAMGAGTYTWANNNATGANISVSPVSSTIYTVTGSVSDPGTGVTCNATNTLQVTVNNNPAITASSNRTNNAICIGESAVLTAGGAGTYTWTGGSGATVSSSITVTPIADQTYAVAGTDGNGCRNQTTIQVSVFPCVGIAVNAANPTGLSVYPNPSNGEFTISSGQEITLQITDQLGREVRTILLDGQTQVKVSDLSNGIYFISGKNANGSVKQKIVVAK